MRNKKQKSTKILKQSGLPAKKIVHKETTANALPITPKENSRKDLSITIGGVIIDGISCDCNPTLWVEFSGDFCDPESQERAEASKIECPVLYVSKNRVKYVESWFIKHLANCNDKIEPFSNERILLFEDQSPFRRSTYENGIRFIEPIIGRILSLPDDCGKPLDNYLMKWFKFWSQAAVAKYGDYAAIQFQDYNWS